MSNSPKFCVLLASGLLMDTVTTDIPPSVSASDLASCIGKAGTPLVIDVRKSPAFDAASRVIAGALRVAPDDLKSAIAGLPRGREVVVYCVHGHEVSQTATRTLAAAGFSARFLEGGFEHWRDRGLPTMARSSDLAVPVAPGAPSRWITRERPKIDRIACPWLIRRFIDPTAEFLFVPSDEVVEAGRRERATPYDVPNVRYSHRGAEGELCSFDSFVIDFGLDEPCLANLAAIVRGADTGKPDMTPQSAGLLAISLGLSVNFPDDHLMLEQGMVIYDAMYSWIKAARVEVHNADMFRKSS